MNGFLTIIYAALLVTIGIKGNAKALGTLVANDAPAYFPWLVSIAFLAVLSENEKTAKFVNPFLLLAALGLLINKRGVIFPESQKIFDHYTKGSSL